MAFLPFLLELKRPCRLHDQPFALSLTPENVFPTVAPPPPRDYYRPWRQVPNLIRDSGTFIEADKGRFQIYVDVQHFAPDEISVKAFDGFILVEGNHEEKQDEHGWVSRRFTRRYALPEGCNVDMVHSKLSSDGMLTVKVPMGRPHLTERIVPIIRTGPTKTQFDGPRQEGGDSSENTPVENGQ